MPHLRRTTLLASLLLVTLATGAAAREIDDRQRRCLTMIAYAEAAGEGRQGLLAVMKVVRNRVRDRRFAGDACAVALEPGQFQPVSERPELRRALEQPEGRNLAEVLNATSRSARLTLVEAWRLAGALESLADRDPTGGALYFVNPRLMDPAKCPWFAGLRRTAAIGEHVFMTHYRSGEKRRGPALDCATAGRDFKGTRLAGSQATGLFDPAGAKVATRTVTPRMLQAMKRTGQLGKRQAELKRHFKPGWYHGTE